ncbi:hypothetical protein NIES4101_53750 [Calothrix sp. NIES-4101]|nr:hypothetical protein NIES4101_53750 [Calothrix sp. NIES-4101]
MLYIQIRKAILKTPGITATEIFKRFPQHHTEAIKDALNILVNSKFVEFRDSKYFPHEAIAESTRQTSTRQGRRTRKSPPFFAKNLKIDHLADGKYKAKRSLREEMLAAIEQNPGITAGDLAALLRCSQAHVNYVGRIFAFASLVKIELLPDKESGQLVRAYSKRE